MANINLLPWRAELRVEKRNEFFAQALLVAGAAVLLVVLWVVKVNSELDEQIYRNEFVQKSIAELNAKIKEIDALKTRRAELVARMEVIQGLQGNRAVIVHLFDTLVRVLPDGVYYEKLSRKGGVMTLTGVAESTNRISNLMRNFEASDWFASPTLSNVVAANDVGEGVFESEEVSRFTLSVRVSEPKKEQDEGAN